MKLKFVWAKVSATLSSHTLERSSRPIFVPFQRSSMSLEAFHNVAAVILYYKQNKDLLARFHTIRASARISTIIPERHRLSTPTEVQVGLRFAYLFLQISIMIGSWRMPMKKLAILCAAPRPSVTPALSNAASQQSIVAEI
jgi:hypothetical protein